MLFLSELHDKAVSFGKAVRACRLQRDLLQRQLGGACSPPIKESRISLIECARSVPVREHELHALLAVLPEIETVLRGQPPAIASTAIPDPIPPKAPPTRVSRLTPFDALPDLLKIPEAAAFCSCSGGLLRDAIRDGRLGAVRLGRLVRVPRDALREFLGRQANATKAGPRLARAGAGPEAA